MAKYSLERQMQINPFPSLLEYLPKERTEDIVKSNWWCSIEYNRLINIQAPEYFLQMIFILDSKDVYNNDFHE